MITLTIPNLRTKNPLNGATGNSKRAGIIRSRERQSIRSCVRDQTKAAVQKDGRVIDCARLLPVSVEITRVSAGKLDAWDGLPASLKPVVDGVADAFGVRDDDPRISWEKPQQRKCKRGSYGVEIRIVRLAADRERAT